jgi:putative oxidoreductase
MDFLRPYTSQLLSVLRIVSGLILLERGVAKFLDIKHASVTGMSGAAGAFEVIVGILLVIGLFTRSVALILSAAAAVAYVYAFFPHGVFPIFLNGGELVALYCFVMLYIAAAGGGAWSADKTFLGKEEVGYA